MPEADLVNEPGLHATLDGYEMLCHGSCGCRQADDCMHTCCARRQHSMTLVDASKALRQAEWAKEAMEVEFPPTKEQWEHLYRKVESCAAELEILIQEGEDKLPCPRCGGLHPVRHCKGKAPAPSTTSVAVESLFAHACEWCCILSPCDGEDGPHHWHSLPCRNPSCPSVAPDFRGNNAIGKRDLREAYVAKVLTAAGYSVETSSTSLPDGTKAPVWRAHWVPGGSYRTYLDAHDRPEQAWRACAIHAHGGA